MSGLQVGAGKSPVNLGADCFPNAENFGSLHDNHVRALYINCGGSLLIVTIEVTSIMPEAMADFLEAACRISGLNKENIWVCATHTFGAPHLWNEGADRLKTEEHREKNRKTRKAFTEAVEKAVGEAVSGARCAKLGYGEGKCFVNVSRDAETSEGWWLGHNEDEVSDKTVAVLKFEDEKGEPIAVLFNYGVQSSVTMRALDKNGHTLITGDLAGEACLYVEKMLGVPTVFCVGACGDQAPIFRAMSEEFTNGKRPESAVMTATEAFFIMQLLGERLGQAVLKTVRSTPCKRSEGRLSMNCVTAVCPGQTIRPISELRPTREYDYGEGGEAWLSLVGAKIGNVALVGALPEMTSRMALRLKSESPVEHTVLLNMVSSIKRTEGKYLADDEAYEKNKYEAMNSKYARGSGEIFHKCALDLLERLYKADH